MTSPEPIPISAAHSIPGDQPADSTPTGASVHLRVDASYRRPGDGVVVIGGSPLRLLTLSAGGVDVLRRIERGESLAASTPGLRALIDRLIDLGIVHPVHDPDVVPAAADLTVVTPVFRDRPVASTGATTSASTGATTGPRPARSTRQLVTIVVDDASRPALAPTDVPVDATIVRLDHNVGPGGARNAGLAEVDTSYVAFVDDDVEIDDASLCSLLAWFDDPKVALVAPRIRAAGTATGATAVATALARFEMRRSPLDLGDQPARVAPTTRVSYVPAAVIVCRTEAVRAVGGFDAELRWGEDVDLVWRLHEAGWRCRYEPSVVARHRTRSTVRAWASQRFRYGTSAAPLAARHPGALAPLRMSGWSAATWIPIAAGWPVVGVAIGAGTTVALVRKLRQLPPIESARLAGSGNLYAGRLWATTLTRAWWPVAAAAALMSRRARRVLAAAVIVPIVLDRRAEPSHSPASADGDGERLDPVRHAVLHLLDDLAYGAGVWVGAARQRSLAALLPSFESWPPRDTRDTRDGSSETDTTPGRFVRRSVRRPDVRRAWDAAATAAARVRRSSS